MLEGYTALERKPHAYHSRVVSMVRKDSGLNSTCPPHPPPPLQNRQAASSSLPIPDTIACRGREDRERLPVSREISGVPARSVGSGD